MVRARACRRFTLTVVVVIVLSGGTHLRGASDFPPLAPESELGGFVMQAMLPPATQAAISGDVALLDGAGVVRVFERDPETDEWAEVWHLTPSEQIAGFGRSFAIDRSNAIVGAEGAAFIFRRRVDGTWQQTAKLTPSEASPIFGGSVDVDGRYVVVGSPVRPPDGAAGAYVFKRETGRWSQVARLLGDPGAPTQSFSVSVRISQGTVMMLSASGPEPSVYYWFDHDQGGPEGWGVVKRLPQTGVLPGFFRSHDIDGDTAIIGGGEFQYRASIFGRNQDGPNAWGTVGSYAPEFCCGRIDRIALSEDRALLHISGMNPLNEVQILARHEGGPNGWERILRLVPTKTQGSFDWRTDAVALSGDTALVPITSTQDPDLNGVLVLTADVDLDGIRDGRDACPRDPQNNIAENCRRTSAAYPNLDDHLTQVDFIATLPGPRRTVLTATFTNTSAAPILNPFFEVTWVGDDRIVLMNGDGGPDGLGATLSPDVGDGVLSPGETMRVDFVVRHPVGRSAEIGVTFRGDVVQ